VYKRSGNAIGNGTCDGSSALIL